MISSDLTFSKTDQDFLERPILTPVKEKNRLNCVLLVDDDRATNFLNKRLLDKMGVVQKISIARNGEEAMDYLVKAFAGERDNPVPDVILLDINMPLVNGWEFLEQYEALPEDFKNSIAIYMLSTSLRESDTAMAEHHPLVKGFIHKPLTVEQAMRFI